MMQSFMDIDFNINITKLLQKYLKIYRVVRYNNFFLFTSQRNVQSENSVNWHVKSIINFSFYLLKM